MTKELKAVRLTREIAELYNQLYAHQAKCKHTKVIKVANSDTGNWCPADDSYWYDCACPTCLKSWTEDQ